MPTPSRSPGIAAPVGVAISASSVQAGAAIGATVFPLVGPLGVVGLRQVVAAVALMLLVRPPLRRIGLRRLRPALVLGLVLVGMNLTLYLAVQRIGLGLAVTVEFLGPLSVALLGAPAAARSVVVRRVGAGALALVGVVLVTDPFTGASPDGLGLGLAVVAALLWAAYILVNERAGALPGVTGTAVASLVGTALTLPVLVVLLAALPTAELPRVIGTGVVTGLLSSALPYSIDLLVLRRMPRSLFGVLQSLHPVAAAVFGLLVLGQALVPVQLVGIGAVCAANVGALLGPRAPGDPR